VPGCNCSHETGTEHGDSPVGFSVLKRRIAILTQERDDHQKHFSSGMDLNTMNSLKEYEPEPLVETVTGLDWNMDHARHAMRAIQETLRTNAGDDLSDADAIKLLGRLVERRFIYTRMKSLDDRVAETGWRGRARHAKYFRVPDNER
jgi:hypothetical protein